MTSGARASGTGEQGAPTVVEAAVRGAAPAGVFEARLERYVLEERIGDGGMSSVHRARDAQTGEQVALKLIDLRHAGGPDEEELVRGRFERELRTAAALSHPNIARVLSFGRAPGQLFLAMELVPGVTLQRLVEERGTLPVPVALEVLRQLLAALEHAHAAQVIHRDLKPANVMVTPDGVVKLLDFGIARSFGDATLTATGMLIGTPSFMAPEQVKGKPTDVRTDLFSAAATLWMMLSGRARFADLRAAVVLHKVGAEPLDTLLDACPLAPPELDRFLGALGAQDPARRFASAADARAALAPLTPWTDTEGRALLARYQADPAATVDELSRASAAQERARADALLARGGADAAAALALHRAQLLQPAADVRKRLKSLCAASGFTFDPIDDEELAPAQRALAEQPASAPLNKRVAELYRARGHVQGAAVHLARALRVTPDDASAATQLSALVEGGSGAPSAARPARPTSPARVVSGAPLPPRTDAAPVARVVVEAAAARTPLPVGPLAALIGAAAVIALVFAGFQVFVRESANTIQQSSSQQDEAMLRAEQRAADKAQSQQLVAARAHFAAGQFSSAIRQSTLLLGANPPAEEALEALWIRARASARIGDPRTAVADLELYLKQCLPNDERRADVEALLKSTRAQQ